MIASLSGIRGIINRDVTLQELSRFTANFVAATRAGEILLATDSRKTGPAVSRTVAATAMSRGANVVDLGIISTPALFRESRMRGRPAVMVTASHNEPEFNGLKFLVDGVGIGKDTFGAVMNTPRKTPDHGFGLGSFRTARTSRYADDLVARFGPGSCEGVGVALDLGGGAAISHATHILRRLGCETVSINDAYGVFSRTVDPVADDLALLRKLTKESGCSIGLGFDCDGDRLVIVDADGKKRTGDYMLTLALSQMIPTTPERNVVVSVDTTQAIDDVVRGAGGEVFRSKVGEANVVGVMNDSGARFGGEGSSGGLIDGSFNYCRDSMLAALVIISALKKQGKKVYDSVPAYHQARLAVSIPRERGVKAIKALVKKRDDADTTDGAKVVVDAHSWVLIRPSGTEDIVRVSAESTSMSRASEIADSFAKELRELSR